MTVSTPRTTLPSLSMQMTTILCLIKDGDVSGYRELVNNILAYGEDNHLILNIHKTKEAIMDFKRKPYPLQPLIIKGTEVKRADSHKFLGLHVSSKI